MNKLDNLIKSLPKNIKKQIDTFEIIPTKEDKKRFKEVSEFVKKIEKAHKNAKKSKLIYKQGNNGCEIKIYDGR